MRELERRRRVRHILYSTPILILLALVFAALLRSDWKAFQSERESREALRAVEGDLARLSQRQTDLTAAIERLETPRGVEEEILEKFHMGRPGEKMVVIVDEKKENENDGGTEKRWWERFLGLFGQ